MLILVIPQTKEFQMKTLEEKLEILQDLFFEMELLEHELFASQAKLNQLVRLSREELRSIANEVLRD